MDQEMFIIEQEKNRNMMLLQGMHNVTAAYIAGGNCPPSAAKSALGFVPQTRINNKSYPGTSYIDSSFYFMFQYICSSYACQILN